jgi:hypothetical protein
MEEALTLPYPVPAAPQSSDCKLDWAKEDRNIPVLPAAGQRNMHSPVHTLIHSGGVCGEDFVPLSATSSRLRGVIRIDPCIESYYE